MQFKRDFSKVFSANFLKLLIAVVTGILVPAFLSLDQYALLKTFTLYVSYIGILHFGFIDGLYIKYGGKYEHQLDKSLLMGEHRFLFIFQLIITTFFCGLGMLLNDYILVAFSLAILPINMQSLFKFLYQALGQFSIYSKIVLITPSLLLLSNLFIIFFLKLDNFWPFVIGNLIVYYIVFVLLERHFRNKNKIHKKVLDYKGIKLNFKVGIFIMAGNFSAIFFYAVDRWFVKIFMTVHDFAYYSFAISLLGLISIMIGSVTMVFYPYLARSNQESVAIRVKKYLLIVGVFSSSGYFLFNGFINKFMIKYNPALEVILVIFASFPAMVVINALFVNLYKVQKKEKTYFIAVMLMCIVATALNFLAITLMKSNLSIAIATTISFYVWYFYSVKDFPYLKSNFKEISFIVIFLISYFTISFNFPWFFGGVLYLMILLILCFVFYKKEFLSLFKMLVSKL